MLKYLTIVTNWTCNSRCTTCFLWKFKEKEPAKLLRINDYKNLFQSESLRNLKSIYFTGGEPTINKEFVSILKLVHRYLPKAVLSYTTNALAPKLIIKQVEELQKANIYPHISLSLNGREKIHDQTRGIKGNFNKVIFLAKELRKKRLPIFFNFTIFPFNLEEILPVYKISRELEVAVNFELARSDKRYHYQGGRYFFDENKKQKVIENLAKISGKGEMILKSYLFLKEYFGKKEYYFDCRALQTSIYVDPYGTVFPCDGFLKDLKLGNIKRESFDKIIHSKRYQIIKRFIREKRCQPCHFTCEMKLSMQGRFKRRKFINLFKFVSDLINAQHFSNNPNLQ